MDLEDQFSPEENDFYAEKVNDILKVIKAFREEKAKVNEPKIYADAKAYLLDNLEQAFNDLIQNRSMGRKQWYRQHQNISKNYRFDKGLNEIWAKIESRYDAFWFDLSLQEKKFITMGGTTFWLPNFKNKGYEPLEMTLRKDFQEKLNKFENYKETKFSVFKTLDFYRITLPEIATPEIYSIVMHDCKVDVSVNPNAHAEMTNLLYDHLCDYLDV